MPALKGVSRPEGKAQRARLEAGGDVKVWRLEADRPPVFIAPARDGAFNHESFLDWLSRNDDELSAILSSEGAIVLRGFPLADTAEFDALAQRLGPSKLSYASGAATRQRIAGSVFEATRVSGDVKIGLHQEMTYLPDIPGRLAFFCAKPAEEGGETIIGDMRRFTRAIPADLKHRIADHGTRVVRTFAAPPREGEAEKVGLHPDQRSWIFAFYTSDKAEVERVCDEKGLTPIWHDDDSLTVETRFPSFATHPASGEEIYRSVVHHNDADFNETSKVPASRLKELDALFKTQKIKSAYTLGDGTVLSRDERRFLTDLFKANEISWSWRSGDVLIVDNLLVAHGRNPYSGERDVQVALLA